MNIDVLCCRENLLEFYLKKEDNSHLIFTADM